MGSISNCFSLGAQRPPSECLSPCWEEHSEGSASTATQGEGKEGTGSCSPHWPRVWNSGARPQPQRFRHVSEGGAFHVLFKHRC